MNPEKIYKNNMNFIKKTWTELYKEINKADISDIDVILPKGSNNINLSINGNILYPDNPYNAITEQVDTFVKKPTSFYKKPSLSVAHEIYDFEHDSYLKELEQISPYVQNTEEKFNDYALNLNSLPYLLMFGIGTGQHIQQLIEKIDIKYMVVLDESYSMLKVSMHLIDWRPIFRHFQQENYGLEFVISNSTTASSATIINNIFAHRAYNIYFIPYYIHYYSKAVDNLKKAYLEKVHSGFTGWGFYDDEITSLNHTIQTINYDIPPYTGRHQLPENSSIFIIGSGPSVDDDIEYIKKHQDNVIICSCSSSIGILEANGITPDFHFEIERPEKTYTNLDKNVPHEFMKKVDFIGLNVIHPEVHKLFRNSYFFCRQNDAGASIMNSEIPFLDHTNPTTPNAAVSFASHIGFKNIYLFGVDLGFRSNDKHHSKDSIYYTKDIKYKKEHKKIVDKFKSNFGNDEIFTNYILRWTKQRLENCIIEHNLKQKEEINYFNCSNGAYIKNTISLKAEKININNIDKEKLISSFKSNFAIKQNQIKHFHKQTNLILKKEQKELNNNIDNIIKGLSVEIKSFSQFFDILFSTYSIIVKAIVHNREKENKAASLTFSLLRGSIAHMYAMIFTHSLAGNNKEDSIKYINEGLKKIIEFLKLIKNRQKGIKID